MDAPDTTELLEQIERMQGTLGLLAKYCEHPDVTSLPFATGSKTAADRARKEMDRAANLLRRAGY